MACTETGLKTCERPAVFTLKPLRKKRRRKETKEERSQRGWRIAMERDVNNDWTQLVHGTIQNSHQWNIPHA